MSPIRNRRLRGRHAALGLLVPLAALAAPGAAGAQSPRAQPQHSVDSLRIGCSGGVRGSGSGNHITSDGRLSSYTRELGSPAMYTLLRHDSVAAAAVFAKLRHIGFRRLRYNEISNMTCVLELRDRAGEHWVSWSIGRPPAALEPVLTALDRAFGDDRRMWR